MVQVHEAPTIDRLRADLQAAQQELATLRRELADIPKRVGEAARQAARTGNLETVKDLQAKQLVIPEQVKLAEARVANLTDRVDTAHLAELQAEADRLWPAVEETQAALKAAEEAAQRAMAAHQNAVFTIDTYRENVRRRRQGLG